MTRINHNSKYLRQNRVHLQLGAGRVQIAGTSTGTAVKTPPFVFAMATTTGQGP